MSLSSLRQLLNKYCSALLTMRLFFFEFHGPFEKSNANARKKGLWYLFKRFLKLFICPEKSFKKKKRKKLLDLSVSNLIDSGRDFFRFLDFYWLFNTPTYCIFLFPFLLKTFLSVSYFLFYLRIWYSLSQGLDFVLFCLFKQNIPST